MHYAVADYVLDIAENAIEADPRLVSVDIDESEEGLRIQVSDDGRGMSGEELGRALDPFWTGGGKHPGRRVGLGLPFLVQGVEQAGGEYRIESERGRGTRVAFSFPALGPDVPPLGDMAGLLAALTCLPGGHELRIRRRRRRAHGRRGGAQASELDYEVSRSELAAVLGDLERVDNLVLLRDYLRSQEEDEVE
jgi:hypothetical protein